MRKSRVLYNPRMNRRDTKKRNIRDLSYLPLKEGKHLRKGVFYRSAFLRKFSRKGKKELLGQKLSVVIDLRTPGEIMKKPDEVWPGVTYVTLPVFDQATLGISHEKGLKAYKKPPVMIELYRLMVTSEPSIEALKKGLGYLLDMDREGAILWHCTAGKDRSGVLSALFLLCLGCNEEDILSDYERSDKESRKKGALYRFLLRVFFFGKELADGVYNAMRAKREYLQSAFDAMKETSGSIEKYLEEKMGVTPERIEMFLEKYGE